MKKCVITGMGIVCSLGNNLENVWNNMVNSVCGIHDIKSFDTTGCNVHIAGEANMFIPDFERAKEFIKIADRTSLLAITSVNEAIKHAELKLDAIDLTRLSVVFGSCTGGAVSIEKCIRAAEDSGQIDSSDILKMPLKAIAPLVAYYSGAKGTVANIGNACAAGSMSIAYACDLISSGDTDVVIAGGADAFSPLAFSGFYALHALDEKPCSPLSRSQGLSLGEGAAAVIVESLEHAQKRDARILCDVRGYATSSDAYHITAPEPTGEGQKNAILRSMKMARTTQVDYINAHGTGTPMNDKIEKKTISDLFSFCHNSIKISSTKSLVGHCLGAAGAMEAVLSIYSLLSGVIIPTINFDMESSSTSEFNYVPNNAIKNELHMVMSNSFAFGGNNASVIFAEPSLEQLPEKANERVFITGMGILSPLGNSPDNYVKNLEEDSKESLKRNLHFSDKAGGYYSCVSDPNLEEVGLSPFAVRKNDRMTKHLLYGGLMSLKDAQLNITPELEHKIGMAIGTSDGPATEIGNFLKGVIKHGYSSASAFLFPNTVYNAAGGFLSIQAKIKGETATFVNGMQSGISSACYGFELITTGREEFMLVAGVDDYSDDVAAFYSQLQLLEKSNPFHANPYQFSGNGYILSEGCTSLILSSQYQAEKRKSRCYAEIIGYGLTNTPVEFGDLEPSSEGLERAIQVACHKAKIDICDIDAVVGFANGCEQTDKMEIEAYRHIFSNHFESLGIHSIKARVGESRSAASALQIAHAALMLFYQRPLLTRLYSSNVPEKIRKSYNIILVTGYSMGGGFSAMLLKRTQK